MKIASLIGILLGSVGCGAVHPPDRPVDVAATAIWAGGADGGAWIDCRPIAKEPHAEYECTVHHDLGGVWASGNFIVAERREDGGYEYPAAVGFPQAPTSYESYDGRKIYVRESRLLVPHGWIEYPFGDGHGHRERYDAGEKVEAVDF